MGSTSSGKHQSHKPTVHYPDSDNIASEREISSYSLAEYGSGSQQRGELDVDKKLREELPNINTGSLNLSGDIEIPKSQRVNIDKYLVIISRLPICKIKRIFSLLLSANLFGF